MLYVLSTKVEIKKDVKVKTEEGEKAGSHWEYSPIFNVDESCAVHNMYHRLVLIIYRVPKMFTTI